ncbi:MAG: hypothetical protein V4723_05235 [Pseudomonadota bacterium]
MLHRVGAIVLGLCFVALGALVLSDSSLSGDGYEYVLTMHALWQHGSPNITPADVESLRQGAAKVPFYGATLGDLMPIIQEHLRAPHLSPAFAYTIYPGLNGQFYGIHFGLYSLLAVPLYALLPAFPHYALSLLNLACSAAVYFYLRRVLPERPVLPFVLFMVSGTTFYLHWMGPEVLTASCLLVASIALLRGQAGLAILLAGVAASQNPPLVMMMPVALAYRFMLHKYPQLLWPGSTASSSLGSELLLAGLGLLFALAPFAFSQYVFGVPSVIARDFNDAGLISAARLASLFFDLNQGMLIGVPGLLLTLVLGVLLVPAQAKRAWLTVLAVASAALLLMAVPTLSALNWNSGGVVMTRYSYWLGMPLLAASLLAARLSTPRRGTLILLSGVALQALLLVSTGLLGGKTIFIEHSLPARVALTHFPTLYNPEPEIFHARNQRHVTLPLPLEGFSVFAVDGQPRKIMRHGSNQLAPAGLCPAGGRLMGADVRVGSRGWEYLHAPFTCGKAQ